MSMKIRHMATYYCRYHGCNKCQICEKYVHKGEVADEMDKECATPPLKRMRRDPKPTAPDQEITTDDLFAFFDRFNIKQIMAATPILMGAYLEAIGDDTLPHTENIENMRQLLSLMKNVKIDGDMPAHICSCESKSIERRGY